jgi:hypothetical protein
MGTALCAAIVATFLFTLRRAVIGRSSDSRSEVGLKYGAAFIAWRPPGWRLDEERYPPVAGWSVASYGGTGAAEVVWWPIRSDNKHWSGIEVPLWMLLAILVGPTGLLWYRDRRQVRGVFGRARDWLRPHRRQRVTLKLAVLLMFAHVAAAVIVFDTLDSLWLFFWASSYFTVGDAVLVWLARCLGLGAPAWGVLWAWLFVRYRNRLLLQQPGVHCVECGYDLTGNVSGRCPECGTVAALSADAITE